MLLAMRNPKNLTDSRIIVDSNNFKYAAITEAGVQTGFETPGYFSESAGNAYAKKDEMKTIPNAKNQSLVNHLQVGKTQGQALEDNANIDSYTYANTVYAMSGNEHVTDTAKQSTK